MELLSDLKAASPDQRAKVLALNNRHAAELSWLEAAEIDHLIDQAFFARAVGEVDGFMIGLAEDADYASPNFLWFRQRYPRFAYVDRIVIDGAARGRGLARTLYEAMFAAARADGHVMVACEVNSDPPNPASDAFHVALGFKVVGQASIYGGRREVSYYLRILQAAEGEI